MNIRLATVKQRLIDRAGVLASSVFVSVLFFFGMFAYSSFLENRDKLDMNVVNCYEVVSNNMAMTCYGRYAAWYDLREVPLYHVDKSGVRYPIAH